MINIDFIFIFWKSNKKVAKAMFLSKGRITFDIVKRLIKAAGNENGKKIAQHYNKRKRVSHLNHTVCYAF